MDLFTFKKLYKAECKRLFSGMGFRINGNNCWRVVNDVYQAFYLHNSVDGATFTVEFNSLPLCSFIGYKPKNDPWNIGLTFRWFTGEFEWMKRDIALLTPYFVDHLIPFFENSSTLEGIISEGTRLHNNLLAAFPHLKAFNQPPSISSFAYLKLGMLDKAIPMLRDANPRYIEQCGLDMDRLIARDTVWLSDYLAANERKNRIALGLEKE